METRIVQAQNPKEQIDLLFEKHCGEAVLISGHSNTLPKLISLLGITEEITIAELLKPAGYVSCHIGKWHLGADDWYPQKQGYDFNYGGCDYGQPPSYFDPYNKPKHKHAMIRAGIPHLPGRKPGQYLSDREAEEAVDFIEKHKDKPFFLNVDNYAVHTPIQAKAEVTAKYEKKTKTRQKNAKYAAMVESVDDCVGRIMAALEDHELSLIHI